MSVLNPVKCVVSVGHWCNGDAEMCEMLFYPQEAQLHGPTSKCGHWSVFVHWSSVMAQPCTFSWHCLWLCPCESMEGSHCAGTMCPPNKMNQQSVTLLRKAAGPWTVIFQEPYNPGWFLLLAPHALRDWKTGLQNAPVLWHVQVCRSFFTQNRACSNDQTPGFMLIYCWCSA